MRFALILLLLVWLAQTSKAQDTLRRTDGVLIPAKILDIKNGEITFNKTASTDSLVYIISTSEVEWIRYADGSQRTFTVPSQNKPVIKPAQQTSGTSRNIIVFRPFDLVFPTISLAYEHFSPSQKFSYRIPVSFGLNTKEERDLSYAFLYSTGKSFSTGIDLNFYLSHPDDKFRYYIGPALQLGFLRFTSPYYSPTNPNDRVTYKGTQFAILANNGFWYRTTDRFVVGADIGLGLRRRSFQEDIVYNTYYAKVSLKLSGNISVGITF
ncbi:hypothetical protein GXP67_18100 [Rhodocytophaga rosea]|uniref:Outer membrane protein beta-barrel domain-containing protein n=1 Tax=Rhodocytophaga rosea TaxID=2704465 RepID=A0A6C0GKE4_9BACT|nr:hypothetical protein [Rhodocytophaga rosea]QHT68417.1 hypothetical protein GXP67_18100 [Rhodocytophaga rosea]